MSQPALTPYSTPTPPNAKNNDYPIQSYPHSRNKNFPIQGFPPNQNDVPKQFASPFNGPGNPWMVPSASFQGMVPAYQLCENTPPADVMGNPYECLNYDQFFPNSLQNNLDDFLNLPLSAEETINPNNFSDIKFPYPFQIQVPPQPPPPPPPPQPQAPNPPPPPFPMHLRERVRKNDLLPPRTPRRQSAPEIATQADLERQQKHASRRASHNVVEKRYRQNLNLKFRELEYAILNGGTLCPTSAEFSSSSSASPDSKVASPSTTAAAAAKAIDDPEHYPHRAPKARIIENALHFIERQKRENDGLKERLASYETACGPRLPPGLGHEVQQEEVKQEHA
ncbi:hypothetical protein BDW62DRAFT_110521 [Aspergillus aurantiobrunneus]